jgi:hypothetical protein
MTHEAYLPESACNYESPLIGASSPSLLPPREFEYFAPNQTDRNKPDSRVLL